ncbi:MAG: GHKL domain-containing protein [Phycisphaerales bacterium]|nr:MAG: GHKL domain-containing protein [Phycisphaerales bacterium]
MQPTKQFGVFEKYGLWVAALAVLAGLHAITAYNYLVFHTIVEVFAIVVACGIFMLAWNSREISQNGYLLFLGTAYLFVGILDLVHALAYEGLGIFTDRNTNLATQLWIGARYMESVALLLSPLLVRKRLRAGFVFTGFAVVTALVLLCALYWRVFPVCFEPGVGLTTFKKASEYIIAAILLASVFVLLRRRADFDRNVLRMLVASVLLTVCSELCFTLYRDPYDIANEAGHLLKLASFYLIYRAVIQTGIRRPYAVLLRDLKQSNESLEARNRELLRFASIVRHDLGNPLFSVEALAKCITNFCDKASESVAGKCQELEDQLLHVLNEDIPRSVDSIQRSVELMKTLLEGLRQVTMVGHVPMHIDQVDMNELLQQVATTLAPKARSRGASVQVEDLPACMGDSMRLNEVFGNLLDNAIKYLDPQRQGQIRISGRREDGASIYCVEDNGIGIAPEQRAKVFDVFHRVDPQDGAGGEGLGLFIVRRLVERHHGRIWLESEPGRGSRFFVSLPAAASQGRAVNALCSRSTLLRLKRSENFSKR